jgi:hypothetical protein
VSHQLRSSHVVKLVKTARRSQQRTAQAASTKLYETVSVRTYGYVAFRHLIGSVPATCSVCKCKKFNHGWFVQESCQPLIFLSLAWYVRCFDDRSRNRRQSCRYRLCSYYFANGSSPVRTSALPFVGRKIIKTSQPTYIDTTMIAFFPTARKTTSASYLHSFVVWIVAKGVEYRVRGPILAPIVISFKS